MESGQAVYVRAIFRGMNHGKTPVRKALVQIEGLEISSGDVLVPMDVISERRKPSAESWRGLSEADKRELLESQPMPSLEVKLVEIDRVARIAVVQATLFDGESTETQTLRIPLPRQQTSALDRDQKRYQKRQGVLSQ